MKQKISKTLAILCLIVNVCVLPGLGSLICEKKTEGIWQIVLFVLGIPFTLLLIGIPMMIGAWIWGIVTGYEIVKESTKKNV